jgi:uncharacterized protein (TIGR03067 family)
MLVVGMPALFATSDPMCRMRPRVQNETQAMQGVWVLQTVECCGEDTEQDAVLDAPDLRAQYLYRLAEQRVLAPNPHKYRTTLTVDGNNYTFRQQGKVAAWGCFGIDATQSPRVMERRSLFVDKTIGYSIVKVEGDRMLWCLNRTGDQNKVPTMFATDKDDDDIILLKFKRLPEI